MINHEIAVILAAGAAGLFGFIAGRLRRIDADYPPTPPRKVRPVVAVETTHPYRDSAAPSDEGAPKRKRLRLFAYVTHDKKHVYLCCPACQGQVTEMPVCTCGDVNSDPHVHFHTRCTNCGLRFAMETSVAAEEATKSPEPPKAN
jgi:hypothetical protein